MQTPARQTVRLITLKDGLRLQWTLDFARRQSHQNLTIEASIDRATTLLGPVYRNAHLFTKDADIAARVTKSGDVRLTTSPPSRKPADAAATHDRQKQHLIPAGTPVPFLVDLGVMTADGRIKNAKHDKFRQINRYLEFVDEIYDQLPAEGRLNVIDFGCGLSYLTFALHHLLSVIHGRQVRICGIDRNATVIERCRQTASRAGLVGLEFRSGDIPQTGRTTFSANDSASTNTSASDSDSTTTPGDEHIHLAVSLHACDTATDDALAYAVRLGADVILAAPCCQHELFTRLDSPALSLLTRHGILKERFAALATDALRAATLEQAGYHTQVIEFIDTEHTPKNLLLRAVRRQHTGANPTLADRIASLKQLLGIDRTTLEARLQDDA